MVSGTSAVAQFVTQRRRPKDQVPRYHSMLWTGLMIMFAGACLARRPLRSLDVRCQYSFIGSATNQAPHSAHQLVRLLRTLDFCAVYAVANVVIEEPQGNTV